MGQIPRLSFIIASTGPKLKCSPFSTLFPFSLSNCSHNSGRASCRLVCRLGMQRLTALRRQVSAYLPLNRTYTSPCIRLAISKLTLFPMKLNYSITRFTHYKRLTMSRQHQLAPWSFSLYPNKSAYMMHYDVSVSCTTHFTGLLFQPFCKAWFGNIHSAWGTVEKIVR